jgi:hypothetical protein
VKVANFHSGIARKNQESPLHSRNEDKKRIELVNEDKSAQETIISISEKLNSNLNDPMKITTHLYYKPFWKISSQEHSFRKKKISWL